MNTIETIRAEIERLKKEIYPVKVGEQRVNRGPTSMESAALGALNTLMSRISTLQEQPVRPSVEDAMKELDEKIAKVKKAGSWKNPELLDEMRYEQPVCDGFEGEFAKFSNDVDAEHPFPICVDEFKDFARHFYELGCRRTAEKYDEIEYKRQRADVCEGVDCEIQKYISDRWKIDGINPITPVYLYDFTLDELKECARHFAQWQKEKDEEIINAVGDIPGDIEKAYHNGRKDMREQMMKEAVEGDVDEKTFGYKAIRPNLKQLDTILETLSKGDKVKLIIIKED